MSEMRIQKAGEPAVISASDGRLTLSVPIQIKRRSGRKLVTLPSGEPAQPRSWDVAATPLQLALARGHRWLAMLESGEVKFLKEIAAREGVDASYVSRMVNMTTLDFEASCEASPWYGGEDGSNGCHWRKSLQISWIGD